MEKLLYEGACSLIISTYNDFYSWAPIPSRRKVSIMSLRAGVGTVDITPEELTPLSGYPRVKRISTGVHDPLQVSALHLRNGSSALILVSIDLLCLDPTTVRSFRRSISDQTGLKEE